MSGTSLDGIDAALADLGGAQPKLLARHYQPFDDALRNELLALHQPGHNELHRTQLAGNQLARLYAATVNTLLSTANSSNTKIKASGCHGQTIRHRPEHGYTLQIGNAALLAELTGIAVVSDFRSRDIAAGGQGAPLVPAFHDKVMRHPDSHRVIVNIGGISNLTNLPPNASTSGFDCGPGNLLMDAWCMQHLGRPYDDSGIWAASGKALPALLERMLDEPFFALPPPKSSGRDLFDMAWLRGKLQGGEAAMQGLVVRAAAAQIDFRCAGTVLPDGLRDAAAGQFQQGGLHILRRLATLQFTVQPRDVEQVAPAALGWRQGEERLAEHFIQQCGQHFPRCRPYAAVVVWLAEVLHAPSVHQQVAGAAVEA